MRVTKEGTEIHELCCKFMERVTVEKNKIVFQQGDEANNFYLILLGKVSVRMPKQIENEIGEIEIIEEEMIQLS